MSKSHQKIIDAAYEILAIDPSAPLESIADAADVSRMTIHRLFSTRETLIEAVYNQFTQWGHALVDDALATSDDPITQLESIVKNGAPDGIRFLLMFQIRDYISLPTANEDVRASAESFFVKLKGIFSTIVLNNLVRPNITNAWLFYLYTSVMQCAWNVLKDGVVAPADVPDLAWETFTQGVFISTKL
jgi:AcrR family transcriptional regulator